MESYPVYFGKVEKKILELWLTLLSIYNVTIYRISLYKRELSG